MEYQQAPVVDPAIERELAGSDAALHAIVVFGVPVPDTELERWQLAPLVRTETMVIAHGWLDRAAVRALAGAGTVLRIAPVPQAPAQEKTMDKIDPELRLMFAERPDGVYGVIVVFTSPPPTAGEIEKMNLTPVSPNEATGQLSRQDIEALAKRADVDRIRSRPRPRAF